MILLNNIIIAIRHIYGLSQQDLAKILGVSINQVYYIERGIVKITDKQIEKLGNYIESIEKSLN